jgi:hypothetical protein
VKMNIDIDIAANKMADFVLDFNACKSIVRAGNSGQYLLKPVVAVMPQYVSGVLGYVDATLGVATTSVSLQKAGVVVKSTIPDSTGKFLLEPVAPDAYDLVITAPGHATVVVTGVVVLTDTVTLLNGSTNGLNPPASTSGTAAGIVTVTPTPASIDATADALQTLSLSGDTIEIAGGPVNAVTGGYSYALPTGAPLVAPYVNALGPLVFSADGAASGMYGLAATYYGVTPAVTKLVAPITITPGATTTTNFAFP